MTDDELDGIEVPRFPTAQTLSDYRRRAAVRLRYLVNAPYVGTEVGEPGFEYLDVINAISDYSIARQRWMGNNPL